MTNQEITPRAVAERIEALRIKEGRSVAWLSEMSGVSYKTLRRRLNGAPEDFILRELISIARVLNADIESFVAVEVAA